MTTAESVVFSGDHKHSTDRRSADRAPLDAPALLDTAKSWHAGRCQDVSISGVAVACTVSLPIGRIVEVYFELPNGVAVEAEAQIVRCDGNRVGLRFLALDRSSKHAVEAHCKTVH